MELNKLLASRYADIARRLLGEDILVDSIAPEFTPTIELESDRPEYSFLKTEHLFGIAINQALNAAQNSGSRLRNPVGSNLLVVVTGARLVVSAAATPVFSIGSATTDFTGSSLSGRSRDSRLVQGQGSTVFAASAAIASVQNNTGASLGALALEQFAMQANIVLSPICLPVVLSPGFALQWITQENNIAITANWDWYERPLAALELSL